MLIPIIAFIGDTRTLFLILPIANLRLVRMPKGKRLDSKDVEVAAEVRKDTLECILESVMGEVIRLLVPLFEDVVITKTALDRLTRLLVQKKILETNEIKTTYFVDRERLRMLWEGYIERIENVKDTDVLEDAIKKGRYYLSDFE